MVELKKVDPEELRKLLMEELKKEKVVAENLGEYDPEVEAWVKEGYKTLDSGKRENFESGAVRDVQEGKPRYDLIPVQGLRRLADLYARGAIKYSEDNWRKGMSFKRVMASLLRHTYQYMEGDRTEDHLSSIAWGAMALMYYEHCLSNSLLPESLDDLENFEQRRKSGM